VLLGLLANTSLFGTIWSLGLGAFFAARNLREWRAMLAGAALYALLVSLAIATMIPAPDSLFVSLIPSFALRPLDSALEFAVGAFFPFFPPFVPDTLTAIGGPAAKLAATPFARDPADQLSLLLLGGGYQPVLTAAVLIFPILACWTIVRDRLRTAEFATTYLGVLLFAQLWNFEGAPNQQGTLFVALIGTVWMWRANIAPARRVAWLWIALLAINAVGGVTTLASELRPYSQSHNAANWLQRNGLDQALLIGARDATTSPIAGYLRRPLYYVNCECLGTYVEWSTRRKPMLDLDNIVARVAHGMEAENKSKAILILSLPLALDKQTVRRDLNFEPIKRFPSAIVPDETYVIYRVTRQ